MSIFIGDGTRNTFQIFTQSNAESGVYADAAARDAYFGSNPSDLARLDSNEFLIIKLLDNGSGQVAYQQRVSGAWLDVTSLVQGEVGPSGATGNSYFFASIAARDNFFSNPPNEQLLEADLPVITNIGNDTEATYIWGGETAPITYDSTLWRLGSKEVNSGSLFLGQDGAKISSGSQILGFSGANGQDALIVGANYDDTGSRSPDFFVLSDRVTLPLATVFDTPLAPPHSYTLTTTSDELFIAYSFRPAEAGELRVEVFLGTDDTGPVIVNSYHTILVGDVGNLLTVETGNDILIDSAQDIFVRATGVSLFGGVQTAGPLVGQTIMYNTADVQFASKSKAQARLDNFATFNTEKSLGTYNGGYTVVYEYLATIDTLANSVFTRGIASTSNPTVETVGSNTFSAGQIVSYTPTTGTPTGNSGLFEVLSHVGTTLTVRGIGTDPLTQEIGLKDQFFGQRGTGTFQHVAVSCVRVNNLGVLEQVKGHTTPLTIEQVNVGVTPRKYAYFYDEANISPTTISGAGVYTDIICSLSGDLLEGFTVSGNTLTYTATKPINAEISWNTSVDANTDSLIIKAFKNGTTPLNGRSRGRVVPNNLLSLELPLTVTHVVSLVTGDTVDLKITDAFAGTTVTVLTLSGSIKEIT